MVQFGPRVLTLLNHVIRIGGRTSYTSIILSVWMASVQKIRFLSQKYLNQSSFLVKQGLYLHLSSTYERIIHVYIIFYIIINILQWQLSHVLQRFLTFCRGQQSYKQFAGVGRGYKQFSVKMQGLQRLYIFAVAIIPTFVDIMNILRWH